MSTRARTGAAKKEEADTLCAVFAIKLCPVLGDQSQY